jgi:hypothetical protein
MDKLQSFWKIRDAGSMPAATILHFNIVVCTVPANSLELVFLSNCTTSHTDAAAFWLTTPLLPYLSKELGADRVTFGYLQSALEAAQIVSRYYPL